MKRAGRIVCDRMGHGLLFLMFLVHVNPMAVHGAWATSFGSTGLRSVGCTRVAFQKPTAQLRECANVIVLDVVGKGCLRPRGLLSSTTEHGTQIGK